MNKKEEDLIYYSIIAACVIGIIVTSYVIFTTPRPQEQFTELYFYFEKIDCNNNCTFKGYKIFLKEKVWIDFDNDGMEKENEIFSKGDTIRFGNEYWNLVDFSDTQILFGKYPKKVEEKEINFSFVIVNHLGKEYIYTYEIRIDENMVFRNTVLVEDKEKKIVDVSIEIQKKGETKISITLDTGEEIHFWLYYEGENYE